MRISSSFFSMLGIFFGIIAIFLVVIYIPGLSDFLVKYGSYFLGFVIGGFLIYVLISMVSLFSSVYADEVLGVFLDVNNKDFHLFCTHRDGRSIGGDIPDRMIQHYFITEAEGKWYYHKLFSHRVSDSGEYEGYTTLKESVVNSAELQESLRKLSHKLNQSLALGERINGNNNNDLYRIDEHHEIQINKVEKFFNRQLMVCYTDTQSKKELWRVGI